MATKKQVGGIGGRIAQARAERGISQVQLAIDLKQAERTVQSWERNERHPRLPSLIRMAAYFEKPVAWFYMADDDKVAA